jgi:hypothetical protein
MRGKIDQNVVTRTGLNHQGSDRRRAIRGRIHKTLITTNNRHGQDISMNSIDFGVHSVVILINGNKAEGQEPTIASIQESQAIGAIFHCQLGPDFAIHRHEITKELSEDIGVVAAYLGSLAMDKNNRNTNNNKGDNQRT